MPPTISHASIGHSFARQLRNLWRKHSDTLGFFPQGAFDDCSRKGTLWIATEGNQLLGYLAYRITDDRALVVHLCVDEAARSKGIARALSDHLKSTTKDLGLRGIGLSCRPDFPADKMWPKLGFVPIHERVGRSRDGKLLKFWWFDHGVHDLFSLSSALAARPRLQVAIDANVLFDLNSDRAQGEESRSLNADWLQSEIELCVADEIYLEIDRGKDSEVKQRNRTFVAGFRTLHADDHSRRKIDAEVTSALGPATNDRQRSDRAHLVKAVATGCKVLLTRDEELLSHGEVLGERLQIRILTPVRFISELDELRRKPAYEPAKLAGSHVTLQRLKAEALDDALIESVTGDESAVDFKHRLHGMVSNPSKHDVFQVHHDGQRLALIAYGQVRQTLNVPLLRVTSSRLGSTLTRHLALRILQESSDRGTSWISICDPHLAEETQAAFHDLGFLVYEGGFCRLHVHTLGPLPEVLSAIRSTPTPGKAESALIETNVAQLATAMGGDRKSFASQLEHRFWPVKILGEGVPSFIAPIHPKWAQHLVDPRLATQELYGADPTLSLNREHIYYRAAQQCGLKFPGRILWYATQDGSYDGCMAIRACSRLIHVETGPAKELYKKHEHLGVYGWPNIYELAKRNAKGPIMAIRFADTELFHRPIELREAKKMGLKSNLQSPVAISDDLFKTLYQLGTSPPPPIRA